MPMSNNGPLEILVVDDDKVVGLLHKTQLRLHGIQWPPVLCENGLEALEYILKKRDSGKEFLVFLDLNMPVLNGWKFLKKLKKQAPEVKVHVVIVTSSINQKDKVKAEKFEEVIFFCRKPLGSPCVDKILALEELNSILPTQSKTEDTAG